MNENPFSEPEDSDRTIIRPIPGGKPPPGTPPKLAPKPTPVYGTAENTQENGPDLISMGGSPLLRAAAPLLQFLARLRNTLNPADNGDLRERAVLQIRIFEKNTQNLRISQELVGLAHYALCASLDDVVLATPWGSQGEWAQHSLVSTFHQEVRSGERFFDLMAQTLQRPDRFLPVLELMYLCLSLGYMGRYRVSPRGPADIDRLREEAYTVLRRHASPANAALSVHWLGVAAPYRPRRFQVPVWMAGIVALGILGLAYAGCLFSLSRFSDTTFRGFVTAPLSYMPEIVRNQPVVPPAEPQTAGPNIIQRLSTFLEPEIKAGEVTVLGTIYQPIIRVNSSTLFASGSARVDASAIPLLLHIGEALAPETGSVNVIGYTDDQPIHTLQYPSNFTLSQARSSAAAVILRQVLGNDRGLTAKGMGDASPVASNKTYVGRAENRRIEILLDHPSGN